MLLSAWCDSSARHSGNNSSFTFAKSNFRCSLKEPRGLSEVKVLSNETCPSLAIEPQISAQVEVVGHRISKQKIVVGDGVDAGDVVDASIFYGPLPHSAHGFVPQVGEGVVLSDHAELLYGIPLVGAT